MLEEKENAWNDKYDRDKRPWLIQRMKFKDSCPEEDFSLAELIKCEYMGAAEFEYGAGPTSLRRIIRRVGDQKIYKYPDIVDYKGDCLCIISDQSQVCVDLYKSWIELDIKGELRLKECTRLDDHMASIGANEEAITAMDRSRAWARSYVTSWWDLQFDVFFTFGEASADRILKGMKGTYEDFKRRSETNCDEKDKEYAKTWMQEPAELEQE